MQGEIEGVRQKIIESAEATVEYANAIRQIKWDMFDRGIDGMNNLISESEFFVEMMKDDLFDKDTGNLTASGITSRGLMVSEYQTYISEAQKYGKEIDKIKKDLEADPKNATLIDRYYQLTAAQRDAIKNSEEEKKKIQELYKQGYDKLIASIKKLIDEYNKAANSAKELHDYQTQIQDKTDSINSIQKQILAYSNGDTEENRATLQKLNEDLKKAQRDLEETEREKAKKDREDLLNKFMDDLQEWADDHVLDINSLLNDAIRATNENKNTIKQTLDQKTEELGVRTTGDFQTLWNNFATTTGNIINATSTTASGILNRANHLPDTDWTTNIYDQYLGEESAFVKKITGFHELVKEGTNKTIKETKKATEKIRDHVKEIKKEKVKEIKDSIKKVEDIEADVKEYTGELIPGKIDGVVDAINEKDLSVVVNVDPSTGTTETGGGDDDDGGDPSTPKDKDEPSAKKYYHITNTDLKYDTAAEAAAQASVLAKREAEEKYNNLPSSMPSSDKKKAYDQYLFDARKKYQVKYYKHGGLIGSDESFLDAIAELLGEDHMIAAREGERVLTEEQNKNFEKMVNTNFTPLNGDYSSILADKMIANLSRTVTPNVGTMTNVGNTTTVGDVNITLPNVTNKQEFVQWLKSDGQIEKIIQSMTVDRMVGGNSFAKMRL